MKKEELFDIIGEVDEQKILNADKCFYEKRKTKNTWLKWGTLAACLLIVSASVIGIFSKSQKHIVTLENGDKINFSATSDFLIYSLDISIGSSRDLSEAEANAIFETCDIEAFVSFEEESNEFIILEGTIDGFSIDVHRKDIPSCVVVEGEERISYIKNIPVTAGYTIIKNNGTAVVYGEFEVDNYRIHIETAGDKSELETLCKKTAEEVFKLIENSSLDFEVIK